MNKSLPLVFLILFSACGNQSAQSIVKEAQDHYISARELQNKIRNRENILIIDIRTPSAYQGGHIPHSINVPFYELKTYVRDHNVQTLGLILVAQYQVEAKQSMKELMHMGYNDIMILSGGIRSWEGALEY